MDLQGRSISSANLNRAGLKPVVGPVRNWRLRHAVLYRQLGEVYFNLAMKAPSSSGFLCYLEYTLVLYSAALPGFSLCLVWSDHSAGQWEKM